MPAYLTLTEFRTRTEMAGADVDEVQQKEPGFIDQLLATVSALDLDARLAKRYAAPFVQPYPEAVKAWLARLATPRVYRKRGVNPDDAQMASFEKDAANAEAQIKEAADQNLGLWDLPARADSTASGIVKGAPLGYSEASPYVAFDVQRTFAGPEDDQGFGSGTPR